MSATETPTPAIAARSAQAVLVLSMLLASMGTSIANVGLPALSTAFDAPFADVRLVVVAYLVTLTATVVVAGRLGDRFGLKLMLLLGLVLFSAAAMLCGLAGRLPVLIAARALQGVGAAFLMTLSLALARQIAAPGRLGREMGLIASASALGTAAGPALGGLLVGGFGWQSLFLVQVPVGLLAAALAARILPPADAPKRAGHAGRSLAWSNAKISGLALNLAVSAVMMTTLVIAPFLLSRSLGLPEAAVGLVMAIGPVIAIFAGVPAGRLVDRWGAGQVVRAGLFLLLAGTSGLALLPGLFGTVGYVMAIAVLTPGFQLFQSGNTTAALADVPAAARGAVSGLLGLSRNLGLVVGAWALGAVFSAAAGTGDLGLASGEAILRGARDVFLLTALIVGGALVLAFMADRASSRTASGETH